MSPILAVKATKPTVQNESDSDNSESTVIYSLSSTPVLMVKDPMDKYKKPKYKFPAMLKTQVTRGKVKFQVHVHRIRK